MAQRGQGRSGRAALLLPLLLGLAACAAPRPPAPRSPDAPLAIGFEETAEPGAFGLEALARRDRPRGVQGLWAVVPKLRRAERAEVTNLETGATAMVALFAGSVPPGEVRLSNAAAELLGIGAAPVRVRLTAVRREAVILPPR